MDAAKVRDAYSAHRGVVYGWAYRVLGNTEDALDVTQEVFIKWWRAHRQNAAPANAVGWLRRVTINHSINLRKARARSTPTADVELRSGDAPPAAELERREIAAALTDAMNAMSSDFND